MTKPKTEQQETPKHSKTGKPHPNTAHGSGEGNTKGLKTNPSILEHKKETKKKKRTLSLSSLRKQLVHKTVNTRILPNGTGMAGKLPRSEGLENPTVYIHTPS